MIDYKNQLNFIEGKTFIKNIPENAISYILFRIFSTKFNFVTHITKDNNEIEFIKNQINFYDNNIKVLEFPDWDSVPYDTTSPNIEIQSKRLETLYTLTNCICDKSKILLLISKKSAIQKTIKKDIFNSLILSLKIGDKISTENLVNFLENNNYNRVNTSTNIGDYSINSNKIDIITFQNCSFRITINKEKIEDLRYFNPITQIVLDSYKDILILPMGEVVLNKTNIQNFRNNYRSIFGIAEDSDDLYKNISDGLTYDGMENWLPLFYNNELDLIFNYIPNNSLISYSDNVFQSIEEDYKNIENHYELRRMEKEYNPVPLKNFYIDIIELEKVLKNYSKAIFAEKDKGIDLGFKTIPNFYESNEDKNAFSKFKYYLNSVNE